MMPIPVSIEQLNGHFVATVLAMPSMRAEADTENEAIDAIRNRIWADVQAKKIVLVDVDLIGRNETKSATSVTDSFGTLPYADDWKIIVEEAYRLRDEQKRAEFPDVDECYIK